MSDSHFGKVFCALVTGAAVGAALGVLFAPDKGTATRRKIAKSSREFKNTVTEKLEDLVESAEEIIEEIKETANEYMHAKEGLKEEIREVEDAVKSKKTDK